MPRLKSWVTRAAPYIKPIFWIIIASFAIPFGGIYIAFPLIIFGFELLGTILEWLGFVMFKLFSITAFVFGFFAAIFGFLWKIIPYMAYVAIVYLVGENIRLNRDLSILRKSVEKLNKADVGIR